MPKPHRYTLAIVPPPAGAEPHVTTSTEPFLPFHVGDEVTRRTWDPRPHSTATGVDADPGAVVRRVRRELTVDTTGIHDTTWVYLV